MWVWRAGVYIYTSGDQVQNEQLEVCERERERVCVCVRVRVCVCRCHCFVGGARSKGSYRCVCETHWVCVCAYVCVGGCVCVGVSGWVFASV